MSTDMNGSVDAVTINRVEINDISDELLDELKTLYERPYHNSHMYEDLINDVERRPDIFMLFTAINSSTGSIVGASVAETLNTDFMNYYGHKPIHGKRLTVLEEYRGLGVGQKILQSLKEYVFDELKYKAVFGESNEVGALSLYGREGALYDGNVVKNYSDRNSEEENLRFFKEFLTNSIFRSYRFPYGDGIPFVRCADDETNSFFLKQGFMSRDDVLNS